VGKKGAKLSETATSEAHALVHDLLPLGPLDPKPMFGGYGIFANGTMFALIDPEGAAHLRVGPDTQLRYEQAGSVKHGRMPYWSIPTHVRDDTAALIEWATESLHVARAAKPSPRARGTRGNPD